MPYQLCRVSGRKRGQFTALAAHDIGRIKEVFLALASYSKPPFRLLRAP